MLNAPVSLGERGRTAPVGAWWQDDLWLTYLTLDGLLSVRQLDLNSADVVGSSTVHRLPFGCVGTPGLAAWQGQLWLAFVGQAGELCFASSPDGVSFTVVGQHVLQSRGDIAMVAARNGLWIAWHEDHGVLHLIRTEDGVTLDDVLLDGSAFGGLSLAYDNGANTLVLGWITREGQAPQISRIDLSRSPSQIAKVDLPGAAPARSVGVAHLGSRTVAVLGQLHAGSIYLSDPVGRTIHDISAVAGGPEFAEFGPTMDVQLTAHDRRAWIGWRAEVDELWFAPYDRAFRLPKELGDLVGKDCDPAHCPPDPRLTCTATDQTDWVWEPPNIVNAKRGDLIMTPADGTGMIGTLLSALTPAQTLDHMGIMVSDRFTVRHSTMAHERVKSEAYYEGSVLGAQPAPTNGLRGDLVKYGWPGTLTQHIEDAFFTGFNSLSDLPGTPHTTLNPRWDYYAFHPQAARIEPPGPGATPGQVDAYNKSRQFNDPERTGDQYPIHNMPAVPQYLLKGGKLLQGIVLKPPPELEKRDPGMRAALHRVVDAAEQLHSHYRFYSYSQAGIALDPAHQAPAVGDPYWIGKPAGADWSAGTPPTVCSSFVWAAVQHANAVAPRLLLEGDVTESPDELLGDPPVDGLYRYTAQERRAAADALATLLSSGVRDEVRAKLGSLQDQYLWLSALARYGIAALSALLLGPGAIAIAALGCSANQLADLALLLNDMPDDIANQMANVFAYDEERNIDDDHWKQAPPGLAVSPDDIAAFWDVAGGDDRVRHGLWGHREQMLLVEGRHVRRVRHVYQENDGLARVHGEVKYRGQPLEGAEVTIGCQSARTGQIGQEDVEYALEVPSGSQEIRASSYWPANNTWLTSRKVVPIVPSEQVLDIDLEDPPEWRRIVRVYGSLELVHHVLVGTDDWLKKPLSWEARLAYVPPGAGPGSPVSDTCEWLSPLAGPERVHVSLSVTLKEDLTVQCWLAVQLLQDFYGRVGEDLSDHIEIGAGYGFDVAPDVVHKHIVDQVSNSFPPDRAHLEISVHNDRNPA